MRNLQIITEGKVVVICILAMDNCTKHVYMSGTLFTYNRKQYFVMGGPVQTGPPSQCLQFFNRVCVPERTPCPNFCD